MRVTSLIAAVLLALAVSAPAADDPDELTPERRKELEKKSGDLYEEAQRQADRGAYDKAAELLKEALDISRRLYPKEKFPEGHPSIAFCLNGLGAALDARGEYAKAEALWREVLEMRRRLYPPEKFPGGHAELANSLYSLGYVLRKQGEYDKAEPFCHDAVDMCRRLYPKEKFPDGHPSLSHSLNNLGDLLQELGELSLIHI